MKKEHLQVIETHIEKQYDDINRNILPFFGNFLKNSIKDREFVLNLLSKLSHEEKIQYDKDFLLKYISTKDEKLISSLGQELNDKLKDIVSKLDYKNYEQVKQEVKIFEELLNELKSLKKINEKEYKILTYNINVVDNTLQYHKETIKEIKKQEGNFESITEIIKENIKEYKEGNLSLISTFKKSFSDSLKNIFQVGQLDKTTFLKTTGKGILGGLLHIGGILTEDPLLNMIGSKILESRKKEIEEKKEIAKSIEEQRKEIYNQVLKQVLNKDLYEIVNKKELNKIVKNKELSELNVKFDKFLQLEKNKFKFEKDLIIDKELKSKQKNKKNEDDQKKSNKSLNKKVKNKEKSDDSFIEELKFLNKFKRKNVLKRLFNLKNIFNIGKLTESIPYFVLGLTAFGGFKAITENTEKYINEKKNVELNDIINPIQWGRNIVHAIKGIPLLYDAYKEKKESQKRLEAAKIKQINWIKNHSSDVLFNKYKEQFQKSDIPLSIFNKLVRHHEIEKIKTENNKIEYVLPKETINIKKEKEINKIKEKIIENNKVNEYIEKGVNEKELNLNISVDKNENVSSNAKLGITGKKDVIQLSSEPQNLISILYNLYLGV